MPAVIVGGSQVTHQLRLSLELDGSSLRLPCPQEGAPGGCCRSADVWLQVAPVVANDCSVSLPH